MSTRQLGRAALAALAATAAWSGAPAVAQAAAPWAPGPLHGDGVVSYPGDVAVSPDGGTTVAWTEIPDRVGAGLSIAYAQRRPLAGGTAPAVPLSPPGAYSVVARVAATADGTTLALAAEFHDPDDELDEALRLTTIAANGSVAGSLLVAGPINRLREEDLQLAVDDAGDALVAWTAFRPGAGWRHFARRIAADGTLGPLVDLGTAGFAARLQAALAPDGGGRLAWVAADARVTVARLTATGQLDGAPQAISSEGITAAAPALSSGGAGVAASWLERETSERELRTALLPGSGPLAGPARTIADDVVSEALEAASAILLGDDGSLTATWSVLGRGPSFLMRTRTIAPDGTPGPVRSLSDATAERIFEGFPRLLELDGGTRYALWLRGDFAGAPGQLRGRELSPDGTPGAETVVTDAIGAGGLAPVAADADALGNVVAGWLTASPDEPGASFATAALDRATPVVTATTSATVPVGEPAAFGASATDLSGIAGYRWEFGDGAGDENAATTHSYASAGTYEASVTVTDFTGRATVVRRAVTVTAPAPLTPGGPPAVDDVPPVSVRDDARAGRKAPARLRIGTVARRGARVIVKGRLDRRADGRVTVVWTQRIGRRTVRRTVRAKVARGRFSATLRLRRALAAARTRPRVTVTYAGDADTRAATTTKQVTVRT